MANQSIYDAFERMWQHTVALVGSSGGGGGGAMSTTSEGGVWVPQWNTSEDYVNNYSFSGGYRNSNENYCESSFGVYGISYMDYYATSPFLDAINSGNDGGNRFDSHVNFFVGNGNIYDRTNAFTVTHDGNAHTQGSCTSESGADYAEMVEWADGNPDAEDRRGLMVVFEGDKLRLATEGETPDGIVSAHPAIIGDSASFEWKGKYLRNVFGDIVLEPIEIRPEEILDNGEIVPAEYAYRRVINPEYDPEREYVSRSNRPEWATVGFVGKLVAIDDGTCVPGGRCSAGNNGIATSSKEGWKVLSRLDETHIKVFVR